MQESVEIDNGSIVFEGVSFRYPEAEQMCLDHISLEIQDGGMVAVVGENGAGKTTFARILLGIYKPDSGRRSTLQESRLYETFLKLAKGKTCIVITHRLGLAKIADRIIVLKGGKIVENGNHHQLLEQGGEYARMWESQAGWYLV